MFLHTPEVEQKYYQNVLRSNSNLDLVSEACECCFLFILFLPEDLKYRLAVCECNYMPNYLLAMSS